VPNKDRGLPPHNPESFIERMSSLGSSSAGAAVSPSSIDSNKRFRTPTLQASAEEEITFADFMLSSFKTQQSVSESSSPDAIADALRLGDVDGALQLLQGFHQPIEKLWRLDGDERILVGLVSLYSSWLHQGDKETTERDEVLARLDDLVSTYCMGSALASMVFLLHLLKQSPDGNLVLLKTESSFSFKWISVLKTILPEDLRDVQEQIWTIALSATESDGLIDFINSIDNVPHTDGDAENAKLSLKRLVIIWIDLMTQIAPPTDSLKVLILVHRCWILSKRHPDMINGETFRLEKICMEELIPRVRQTLGNDLGPVRLIADTLSSSPTTGFSSKKSSQNSLFRLLTDLLVNPTSSSSMVIAGGLRQRLSGRVRDWIPLAQALIDQTRYADARDFCDQLNEFRIEHEANDVEDLACLEFVRAENLRMQRYMAAAALGVVTVESRTVKKTYKRALKTLESHQPSPLNASVELIRAALSLGLSRFYMEEDIVDKALDLQTRALGLRSAFLGPNDALTLQARYAGAEISHRRALLMVKTDISQIETIYKDLQSAMATLDEVEGKWRAQNKFAFVATLKEKRSEILSLWSDVDVEVMNNHTEGKRKLEEAITNIQRCAKARLEIFGPEHLRYKRAVSYTQELISKLNAKFPPPQRPSPTTM